jgi:hypothetical protein
MYSTVQCSTLQYKKLLDICTLIYAPIRPCVNAHQHHPRTTRVCSSTHHTMYHLPYTSWQCAVNDSGKPSLLPVLLPSSTYAKQMSAERVAVAVALDSHHTSITSNQKRFEIARRDGVVAMSRRALDSRSRDRRGVPRLKQKQRPTSLAGTP